MFFQAVDDEPELIVASQQFPDTVRECPGGYIRFPDAPKSKRRYLLRRGGSEKHDIPYACCLNLA
jgi:hypothetical protein